MRKETIGDCELYCGDCLDILPDLGKADAVIADPPYASGGLSVSSRTKSTGEKYCNFYTLALPDFENDALDQRLWMRFIGTALQKIKPHLTAESLYAFFIDWRQLPALIDLSMLAGYIIRGVAVWDKVNCRPQPNYFRQQAEFIVWGRLRNPNKTESSVYSPGVFQIQTDMNNGCQRYHQTQKPLELVKELLRQTKPGGIILDPFMGSGTTGVACVETGRRFVGIEINEQYFDIACKRINETVKQKVLFAGASGG